MKSNIIIALMLFCFTSCGVSKSASSIKLIDGYNYYEQAAPFLKIKLLGDYSFQPFRTKYFRDIDKRFIKYASLRFGNKRPTVLYKAHTHVLPFYSTVCLQYNNIALDTSLITELKPKLREHLNTSFNTLKKIKCGDKDVYKINYQITNSINKIYTSHTEYIFKNGECVYRLLFWTADSDDRVITEEAEYIIKEIQFS